MLILRLACGLAALFLLGKSLRDRRAGNVLGDGRVFSRSEQPMAFHVALAIQLLFALLCGLIAAGFLLPAPNTDMT